ncbi:MAG: hypothetical protein IPP14_01590 [Planctomycetes bacterium]|nr:hypothetical protein [Planctomycetota bacterium]
MRSCLLFSMLLLLATPAFAQGDTQPSGTSPDGDKKPVEPFSNFEVGGLADGEYLPLTLGRDRTGLGFRSRLSFGWDSNVFKLDRNDDSALFGDAIGEGWVGANFGVIALGARAKVAGRLHFGEPDANQWDMKLGGFVKMPYGGGGFGFGLSADVLYQQLQTYELAGPITRQDDLRASGGIARAYIGYAVSFVIFELGVHGQTTDFSEESRIPSYDNWDIGADFSVYINAWDTVELRPYVDFSYEWFRDQTDLQDDGTLLNQQDDLQLLKFGYGVDWRIDLGLIEAEGRAYAMRQDDSAAGFNRYWQHGIRGAIDFNFYDPLRITAGAHFWTREYDDRVDFDSLDLGTTTKTTFERFAQIYAEVSYNVWGPLYLGGRYSYTRRISDVNNGGYAVHQAAIFLELGF